MMKTLRIGEVARQAGVSVDTVRFYERQRLLEEPARRASGYRQYDLATVDVLRFIQRAKQLGFTLREIRDLLSLRLDTSATREEVRHHARTKLANIEAKIDDLQRMRDVLRELVDQCHGDGPAVGCPILQAMQPHDSEI